MTSTRWQSGETCSELSEEASSHLFPTLRLPPAQLIFFPLNLRFPFLNTIISWFSLPVKCFLHVACQLLFNAQTAESVAATCSSAHRYDLGRARGPQGLGGQTGGPAASPALLLVPAKASPFLHTYIPFENLMTGVETLPEKMQMNSFRSFSHKPLPGSPQARSSPKHKPSSREEQEAEKSEAQHGYTESQGNSWGLGKPATFLPPLPGA